MGWSDGYVATAYDHLGQVTKSTRYGGTVGSGPPANATETVFQYDFEPVTDLPRVSIVDPAGFKRETVSNQLGHPLRVEATAPGGSTLYGRESVEYRYSEGAACGCGAIGKPTLAKTTDASGLETEVEREYGPRGEILSEELRVMDGTTVLNEFRSEFKYDAHGNTVEAQYPDIPEQGTSNNVDGSLVKWTMSEHNKTSAMKLKIGSTDTTVLQYKYQGKREVQTFVSGELGVGVVVGTRSLDNYGGLKSWNWDPTGPVSPDINDEVVSRNPDGKVTKRYMPFDGWAAARGGGRRHTTITYVGANWRATEAIRDDESDSGDDSSRDYVITRNRFGKPTKVEETFYFDGSQGTKCADTENQEQEWNLTWDDEGLLTAITEPQGVEGVYTFHERGLQERATEGYGSEFVFDRTFTRDERGWMTRREYEYGEKSGCLSCDDVELAVEKDFVRTVAWDFTYDVWGNYVTAKTDDLSTPDTLSGTVTTGCSGASPVSYDLSTQSGLDDAIEEGYFQPWPDREYEFLYDAFGRIVRSTTPDRDPRAPNHDESITLYHAYDGGKRIRLQQPAISPSVDGRFFEFFWARGKIMKFRLNHAPDGADHYATQLYDIYETTLSHTGNEDVSVNGPECSFSEANSWGGEEHCPHNTGGIIYEVKQFTFVADSDFLPGANIPRYTEVPPFSYAGIHWRNRAPVHEDDVPPCVCLVEPEKCEITHKWDNTHYKNKFGLKPGSWMANPLALAEVKRETGKKTKYYFNVGAAALIKLEHEDKNKDLSNCYLYQSAQSYGWSWSKGKEKGSYNFTACDIGKNCPPGKNKHGGVYANFWFTDMPGVRTVTKKKRYTTKWHRLDDKVAANDRPWRGWWQLRVWLDGADLKPKPLDWGLVLGLGFYANDKFKWGHQWWSGRGSEPYKIPRSQISKGLGTRLAEPPTKK